MKVKIYLAIFWGFNFNLTFAQLNNAKDKNYGIINEKDWFMHKPMSDITVGNFLNKYKTGTLLKLQSVNPNIDTALRISKLFLEELINLSPNAKYVVLNIVQIPSIVANKRGPNGNLLYPQLQTKVGNLAIFLTMRNADNMPSLTGFYDLGSSLQSLTQIAAVDAQLCIQEYENKLHKTLSFFIKKNTKRIYAKTADVRKYLDSAAKISSNFQYILLKYCEVNAYAPNLDSVDRAEILNYNNDGKLSVVWESFNNDNTSVNIAVYDINELCPNHCPQLD